MGPRTPGSGPEPGHGPAGSRLARTRDSGPEARACAVGRGRARRAVRPEPGGRRTRGRDGGPARSTRPLTSSNASFSIPGSDADRSVGAGRTRLFFDTSREFAHVESLVVEARVLGSGARNSARTPW